MEHPNNACAYCHDVWRALSSTDTDDDSDPINLDVPSIWAALQTDCETHKPLIQNMALLTGYAEDATSSPQDSGEELNVSASSGLLEVTNRAGKLLWYKLQRRTSIDGHPGEAIALDKDWIDFSIVKRWMVQCKSNHTRCHNPCNLPMGRPALVIDTQDRCLVPGSTCESYVALSYVWGPSTRNQVSEGGGETMRKMKIPGGLDLPSVWACFPPIVQHAITIVPLIGERYLWIDALCIDHQNKEESAEQLRLMGLIYFSASLTIVLKDGDAQDGLVGIRGASRPRVIHQHVIPFGNEVIVTHPNDFIMGPQPASLYDARGWTCQEWILSRRRLVFVGAPGWGKLTWMCESSGWPWDERDGYRPGDEREAHNQTDNFNWAVNAFRAPVAPETLSGELSAANTRNLTNDEDAFPSVAGLLSIVSSGPIQGSYYGLPEAYFEAALGWQATRPMRRRKSSGRNHAPLGPNDLPSWSWIGWKGPFSMAESESVEVRRHGDLYRAPQIITSSITQWYARKTPGDIPGTPIRSTWTTRQQWSERTRPEDTSPSWTDISSSSCLSAGWRRQTAGQDDWIPPGRPREVFRYKDTPGTWYYPQEVPANADGTGLRHTHQTAFVACKTKRATVQARRVETEREYGKSSDPKEWHFDLLNGQGDSIGTLYANEGLDCPLPGNQGQTTGVKLEELELVAIAKFEWHGCDPAENPTVSDPSSWVRSGDMMLRPIGVEERGQKPKPVPMPRERNYVSVLWVERAGDVCFRRGSGRILSREWDSLTLEEVDLVLA